MAITFNKEVASFFKEKINDIGILDRLCFARGSFKQELTSYTKGLKPIEKSNIVPKVKYIA